MHESCAKAVLKLTQLVKNFNGSEAILDPVKDMRVNNMEIVALIKELRECENTALQRDCNKCPEFDKHVSVCPQF